MYHMRMEVVWLMGQGSVPYEDGGVMRLRGGGVQYAMRTKGVSHLNPPPQP